MAVTGHVFPEWLAGVNAGNIAMTGGTYKVALGNAAGGSSNSITTWTSGTNPSWTTATFTANQAVFYESSASTTQLICFFDFGGSVTVTGATFTLTINASGLLTATVS